uniref:Uncharacterized protein n=1 Tax=viral metagenome TaxID=1070528 RepID=A0A6C0LRH1_9ZZZZ
MKNIYFLDKRVIDIVITINLNYILAKAFREKYNVILY